MRWLAILVVGLVVSATAKAAHLSIATSDWVGYGPLFLARDLGYFKDGGLDVDLQMMNGGTDIEMSTMIAKQVDGVASTVDYVVKYGGPAICFKAVVALDDSYGGDGVLVPNEITDLHQLKGKSIALSESSTSEFWLDYMLTKAGMEPSDITVVNMGPDDAAAAFIAGRVPYAMTWEPHLTFVRESGHGKVLVDSRSAPGVIVDIVALRCDAIDRDRQAVQALVNGILKADDYIKSNPTEAHAILQKYVGGMLPSAAAFETALNGVRYYDRAKNLEYIGTAAHPGPLADIITFAGDLWGKNPTYADGVKGNDFAKIVDPSFVAASPAPNP